MFPLTFECESCIKITIFGEFHRAHLFCSVDALRRHRHRKFLYPLYSRDILNRAFKAFCRGEPRSNWDAVSIRTIRRRVVPSS